MKELALSITWVAGIELRSSSLAGGAFDSLSHLVILFFFVAPNGSSPPSRHLARGRRADSLNAVFGIRDLKASS